MGTTAVTQVQVDGEPIVTIFRQSDGDLDTHGCNLLPMLKRKRVNGYNDRLNEYNGEDNFAAMLVADLVNRHTQNLSRIVERSGSNDQIQNGVPQLVCGNLSIVSHKALGQGEYNYIIKFDSSNDELEPLIDVSEYGVWVKNLSVQAFEKMCETGFKAP